MYNKKYDSAVVDALRQMYSNGTRQIISESVERSSPDDDVFHPFGYSRRHGRAADQALEHADRVGLKVNHRDERQEREVEGNEEGSSPHANPDVIVWYEMQGNRYDDTPAGVEVVSRRAEMDRRFMSLVNKATEWE